MPKRVVVGVGGTGLEVIRSLRRRIVETYPESGLRQFPSLGFFYIDTDKKDVEKIKDNRKRWEVLGKSVHLQESEYLIVGAPAIGRILDDLASYPQLRDWLPVEQLSGLDVAARDTPGAQQIRALGRAIFTLSSDEIKKHFMAMLGSLADDSAGGPTEVIIACSISGGTGSGMFLDLAYSIRRWLQGRGQTTGFLVLPDLMEEAKRDPRYLPNAYAALMDLNYFSQRSRNRDGLPAPIEFVLPTENARFSENPFDSCYLVGTQNQKAESLTLDAVNDMIAHRILLNLNSGVAAGVASKMNNSAMARSSFLADPKNGNQFSLYFSTFGLSTIQCPTEQITEIIGYRLVDEAVRGWLEPPPVDNVNQRVLGRMASFLLTDDHLLGNRDYFGQGLDHPPIPSEVEELLTKKLNATPTSNRAPYLNDVFSGFLFEFRGNLQNFYNTLGFNREGAADVACRAIHQEISDALVDGTLGYPYAVAAVDEVVRLLEVKRQRFDAEKQKLPARIKTSAVTKTAAIGEATKAEGLVFFREAKIKEAMSKVRAAMLMNLTAQAEDRAYEYAMTLIQDIISRLKLLRSEVTEWANAFANLRSEVKKEIEGRVRSLNELNEHTNRFNGSVLFRTDRVDGLYKQLERDEAAGFLRGALGSGESLRWREAPNAAKERLLRGAIEWLGQKSAVRVTGKNVAQQLLEDFPGEENAERQDYLNRAFRRSAPFLEFDTGEIGIYRGQQGQGFSMSPTTQLAALLDHDQKRLSEVVQVRQEILNATGLAENMIYTTTDTQQIVFISELTAFPLRVIKDVRILRDRYRAHARDRNSLPLHIQKAFDPPAGDLMLVSEQEVQNQQRQEENFLIGWVLGREPGAAGWIRPEENPYTLRPEIRYRYQVSGASSFVVVGETRDDALGRWAGDTEDLQAARQRLAGDIDRYFQKIVDARQKQAFAAGLYAALDLIKDELQYGEDDPVYGIYNEARLRIVKRYQLLREGESLAPAREAAAPLPKSASPVPDTKSAAADFEKYVNLITSQLKGKLTDKAREKIEAKQAALKLPVEIAGKILESALSKFAPAPDDSHDADYRELLTDLLEIGDGELSSESESELRELAQAVGLSPDREARIRTEIRQQLHLA